MDKNHQPKKEAVLTQQRKALGCLAPWTRKYRRKQFAVGYQMGSKGGHCVVAKPITTTKGTRNVRLRDYAFMCYQTRTKGRDMSNYMERSFIRWAMFFDTGQGPMEMDVYRETESPGAVINVNSSFSQNVKMFTSAGPVYAWDPAESPLSAASSFSSSSNGLPPSSYSQPGESSHSTYCVDSDNDSAITTISANSSYQNSCRPADAYYPHTPSYPHHESAYHGYQSYTSSSTYKPVSVTDHRPGTVSRGQSNRSHTSDAYLNDEVAPQRDEEIRDQSYYDSGGEQWKRNSRRVEKISRRT